MKMEQSREIVPPSLTRSRLVRYLLRDKENAQRKKRIDTGVHTKLRSKDFINQEVPYRPQGLLRMPVGLT